MIVVTEVRELPVRHPVAAPAERVCWTMHACVYGHTYRTATYLMATGLPDRRVLPSGIRTSPPAGEAGASTRENYHDRDRGGCRTRQASTPGMDTEKPGAPTPDFSKDHDHWIDVFRTRLDQAKPPDREPDLQER